MTKNSQLKATRLKGNTEVAAWIVNNRFRCHDKKCSVILGKKKIGTIRRNIFSLLTLVSTLEENVFSRSET